MGIAQILKALAALGIRAAGSGSGSPAKMAYSGTWAGRPSAITLNPSDLLFINDFPLDGAIGSWWKPIPWLDLYAPLSGDLLLSVNLNKVPTNGSAGDQQVQSVFIPAGIFTPNWRIEAVTGFSKDSGAIAGTYRFRIGENNDDTDTVVHTVSIAAATRSDKIQTDIYFIDTTTAVVTPTANGGVSESTTVWPADVTVADLFTADTYFSVWFEPAGSTVMELKNCRITMYAL